MNTLLFPLFTLIGIAIAGNADVLAAYDYMIKRPNFTDPNLHCWLLVHSAFDPSAHSDALTMVVTTLGYTKFEGYIFAKSVMAANGTVEVVDNEVTRNPVKFGYNSTFDYCELVSELNVDLALYEFVQ